MDIHDFLLTTVVFLLLLNVVIGFQVQNSVLAKSRAAIRRGTTRELRGQRRVS